MVLCTPWKHGGSSDVWTAEYQEGGSLCRHPLTLSVGAPWSGSSLRHPPASTDTKEFTSPLMRSQPMQQTSTEIKQSSLNCNICTSLTCMFAQTAQVTFLKDWNLCVSKTAFWWSSYPRHSNVFTWDVVWFDNYMSSLPSAYLCLLCFAVVVGVILCKHVLGATLRACHNHLAHMPTSHTMACAHWDVMLRIL